MVAAGFKGLPMGCVHAADLAQEGHEGTVRASGGAKRNSWMCPGRLFPRGRVLDGTCIDDHIKLVKVPLTKEPSALPDQLRPDSAEWQEYKKEVLKAGLVPHIGKRVRDAIE
eukprot:10165813-Heterocapsa_arctica.AAC.1